MLATPVIPRPWDSYTQVYEPAEDSFLLLDVLEAQSAFLRAHRFAHRAPAVLEIGTGSGIITTFMATHDLVGGTPMFWATDLNPFACQCVTETLAANLDRAVALEPMQMSLASALRQGHVDVLVFNPPYVPAETVPVVPCVTQASNQPSGDDWLDLALLGGDRGMVVTDRVLEALDTILAEAGVAYILFCASNLPDEVVKRPALVQAFAIELMERRKCGWEVLSVYRFIKRSPSSALLPVGVARVE